MRTRIRRRPCAAYRGRVDNGLRLMHVHAHPDDEASKGAASTAKYVEEGVRVKVVTCTGGERGDVLNPTLSVDPQRLADLRREEMARAVEILGVEHAWLGFEDSGFPEGDPPPPLPAGCFAAIDLEEATAPLIEQILEFRPHVVTTYDENGGYPHPDHIRCHEVTMAAVAQAAPLWQVSKVYYHQTFHKQKLLALHEAAVSRGYESPYAQRIDDVLKRPDDGHRVTTRVPCADYFDVRDAALKAHATQIDPSGHWFALPAEVAREVWPTEDFELAVSVLPYEGPEDDLFAGLR
ncbi:MAG: mycothiol conjugate amidase Mca [Actinobacteria bacterium]|nr:mycothiol conjugate amidase Mca [Actinomycetota bacterium]MCB8997372.1 mycothiol conjugate amidase Mca [Actinomycetota bacterium]MCB9414160.1 mycothiol conjugate amidase Mca [Actinomycetota bacterium]MCB9423679.1 mycothiol conjugate amidase Mca [Actinomycetota bacterium]